MDDGSDVATHSFHGYDAVKYRTGKGPLGGKRGKESRIDEELQVRVGRAIEAPDEGGI